jgi:hypothetical protein
MKHLWLPVVGVVLASSPVRGDVGDQYRATGWEFRNDDFDGSLERACKAFPAAEEQAKLREYPDWRKTLSGGLTVMASGSDRGFGTVGVHVHGEVQPSWSQHPNVFLRGVVEPMWAGRFGVTGEAAIGLYVGHDYGTFYRGARNYLVAQTSTTTVGDVEYTNTTITPVHVPAVCSVASRDLAIYTGIRPGFWVGTSFTDSSTGMSVSAPIEGMIPLELGVNRLVRGADGKYLEWQIAFLADPLYGGRAGAYIRVARPLLGIYTAGDLTLLAGGDHTIFMVTASFGWRGE